MKIENEFIPYEQALALKELGFDKLCICGYNREKVLYLNNTGKYNRNKGFNITANNGRYPAPTFSQAFRWFREKYELSGEPLSHQFQFMYQIIYDTLGDNSCKAIEYNFDSYEEAELECLKKLIEIVKNKK